MALNPRFQIRAPLRCEGVGRLESAQDLDSGDRLAIRWLPLSANGGVVLRTLKPLPAHPALPKIRETGLVGDEAYLALQFPDGRLLPALTEPLSMGVACKMGASLAEGLAALHEERFFHGELSTESILLVADDQVIIWDLPLVLANRTMERRKEHHAAGQLLRCVPFLSPERAKGGEPSAAGDVYALGVVLSVTLGLQLPAEKRALTLLHEVASGSFKITPPVEEPLLGVIGSMLATEPSERPSAKVIAERLRELAELKMTASADAGENAAPMGAGTLTGARRVPARIVMRKVTLPEMKAVSGAQPEGRRETVPEMRTSNPQMRAQQGRRPTAPEMAQASDAVAQVSLAAESSTAASAVSTASLDSSAGSQRTGGWSSVDSVTRGSGMNVTRPRGSDSPGVAGPRSVLTPPPPPSSDDSLDGDETDSRPHRRWGRWVGASALGLALVGGGGVLLGREKAAPVPAPARVDLPVVEEPPPAAAPAPAILPTLRAEPAPETKRRLSPQPPV
ncbi:MAG: protein kinase, partial [Myxococcaceae bacterium]